MTWSLTTVILSLLPVAGTLIVMHWLLKDAEHESGVLDALTHEHHAMENGEEVDSSHTPHEFAAVTTKTRQSEPAAER